jgi:hypothetical protein
MDNTWPPFRAVLSVALDRLLLADEEHREQALLRLAGELAAKTGEPAESLAADLRAFLPPARGPR